MTSGTTTIDGIAYTSSGTFDNLDRPTTATFPKLNPASASETAETLTFGYNGRTLLAQLTSSAGANYLSSFTYNELGQPLTVTNGAGITTSRSYDDTSGTNGGWAPGTGYTSDGAHRSGLWQQTSWGEDQFIPYHMLVGPPGRQDDEGNDESDEQLASYPSGVQLANDLPALPAPTKSKLSGGLQDVRQHLNDLMAGSCLDPNNKFCFLFTSLFDMIAAHPLKDPCGPFCPGEEAGELAAAAEKRSGGGGKSGLTMIGTKSGHSIPVPEGWTKRTADSGQVIAFQHPGALGDADSVRIMDSGADARYPKGYIALDTKVPVPGYAKWLQGFL